jgi:hypothetical protein
MSKRDPNLAHLEIRFDIDLSLEVFLNGDGDIFQGFVDVIALGPAAWKARDVDGVTFFGSVNDDFESHGQWPPFEMKLVGWVVTQQPVPVVTGFCRVETQPTKPLLRCVREEWMQPPRISKTLKAHVVREGMVAGEAAEEFVGRIIFRKQRVAVPVVPARIEANFVSDKIRQDNVVVCVDGLPLFLETVSQSEPCEETGP